MVRNLLVSLCLNHYYFFKATHIFLHTLTVSTPKTQHKVQGRFLLNIVVRECTTILQLLSGENQTLLIGWNPFLVLNFRLDIINCVRRFHIQRDGFTRQGLDKNLR
jgi:hypothetical protein